MDALTITQNIRPTFNLLRLTFGIVPIVAGLDKFTDLLVQWEQYFQLGRTCLKSGIFRVPCQPIKSNNAPVHTEWG